MEDNKPYSIRNNETRGDFIAYMRSIAGDNEEQMDRLKRNLRSAIERELTPRQRDFLLKNYYEGKTVSEIAIEEGLHKSTVSRTITRAKLRLEKVLRYSF